MWQDQPYPVTTAALLCCPLLSLWLQVLITTSPLGVWQQESSALIQHVVEMVPGTSGIPA